MVVTVVASSVVLSWFCLLFGGSVLVPLLPFLKRPLFFMRRPWRFISLFSSIAGRSGAKEAINVRSQKP